MNEIKQHWNTSVQLAANLKAPKKNLGFSVSHANCGITTAVKPLKKTTIKQLYLYNLSKVEINN